MQKLCFSQNVIKVKLQDLIFPRISCLNMKSAWIIWINTAVLLDNSMNQVVIIS
jgi:hypothetical protein